MIAGAACDINFIVSHAVAAAFSGDLQACNLEEDATKKQPAMVGRSVTRLPDDVSGDVAFVCAEFVRGNRRNGTAGKDARRAAEPFDRVSPFRGSDCWNGVRGCTGHIDRR